MTIELAAGFELPLEAVTETFAILANRGSGKSVTAHRLVEEMYGAGLPVVVIDVKGDWWGIRSSADGKQPGLPFVIFGGDHGDVPLEPTAGELLADLIVDDRIPAVLDLSHMSKTKARSFATAFAERLYTRNREALHVVIEEADVLIPQRASADTARLLGAMEDIAKRGRSRGLGMTVVTQRPQEVAKSVLELMETVILMRMTGTRSIKAAQDWIGVNAAEDGVAEAREVIGSLPALQTGEAWVWSPAFLRILKRVRINMFDTFDSHATPKPGQTRAVPKKRADIDLEKLGAEIAATVQRSKDQDPKALRASVSALTAQLADRDRQVESLRGQVAVLEQRAPEYPAALVDQLAKAQRCLQVAVASISGQPDALKPRRPVAPPRPTPPPVPRRAQATQRPGPAPADASELKFRAGAQRMLESLARMAPLRLTKPQWGTVAKMKHTSGTFSTYLGELRRAGLLDEDSIGITLSDAGFEYLGGRPDPMTGEELQQHYLSILRAGAARMLQAVMDAYPSGLAKDELGEQVDMSTASGTFSTYLGELRRNGLIEQRGGEFVATDILMHGAAA
jgi:hypothetical protein